MKMLRTATTATKSVKTNAKCICKKNNTTNRIRFSKTITRKRLRKSMLTTATMSTAIIYMKAQPVTATMPTSTSQTVWTIKSIWNRTRTTWWAVRSGGWCPMALILRVKCHIHCRPMTICATWQWDSEECQQFRSCSTRWRWTKNRKSSSKCHRKRPHRQLRKTTREH